MAMKHWMPLPVAVAWAACVTINVYFPAAEAKEAAKEFVEKVIGEDGQPFEKPGKGAGMAMLEKRVDLWSLVGVGSAYAQAKPDITINTPAIRAIQAKMQQRFEGSLRAGFDAGGLGFSSDGLVVVRDAGKLPLKDRVAINNAVADENRDRKALYREVAIANGHPEWEAQIRDVRQAMGGQCPQRLVVSVRRQLEAEIGKESKENP